MNESQMTNLNNAAKEVVDLYLDDIIPNRFQPREMFDERALSELSVSIKEHGVIQPIIVRKIGDKYEIIAGERRYKASAMAGLTKIPAIIRNLDDKETSKVALLENLQRKDLSAIEEARTYQKILDLDQMTQFELAQTMGKSQPSVANKLRLLTLPDEIQDALLNNKISERHARSLLNLSSKEEQIEMLHKIIDNKLTVRDVELEIRKMNPSNSELPGLETITPLEQPNTNINNNQRLDNMNSFDKINASIQVSQDKEIINNNQTNDFNKKPTINPIIKEQPNIDSEELELIEDFDDFKPEPLVSNRNVLETLDALEEEKPNEVLEKPTLDVSEEEIEEPEKNQTISYELNKAINIVRDDIKSLESSGFVINTDEVDLEDEYQITIKISKNIKE